MKVLKGRISGFNNNWKVERALCVAWVVLAIGFVVACNYSAALAHVVMALYARQVMCLLKEKHGE